MERRGPEPVPADWTEGDVEANGVSLRYVRTGGEHPPLVVAHGVFDDGLCRAPLARELADEYDVVLSDARGHGRSDAPPDGYDPATQAADLLGLVDALDLSAPVLFGHSMGGDTVAAAAARRPDLPRAVVLADPAATLGHSGSDGEGDRAAAVRERIARWHDHEKATLLDDDDGIRAHVEAGRTELASRLADARLRVSPQVAGVFESGGLDVADTYPDVTAPTLLLKADADPAGRARDRDLAAHLPDGRIVHVPGAGHCVFRDERAASTAMLRAFLRTV